MKLSAVCEILRHLERPIYHLVPSCRDKASGVITNWGPVISISEEEMRSHGLDLLLAEFREFPSRDSAARSVPNPRTPEGRREAKAWRESVPICVTFMEDGTIKFIPCARWGRGAWEHLTDSALALKQPTTPTEFFQTLCTAFERCKPEIN